MASQFNLNATKRENLGKRATKRYRKDNLVPAEVYGEKDNQSILINSFELSKQSSDPQFYSNVIDIVLDKKNIEVILKDVQRDPQKSNITHIDFLAVDKNKKIAVNVPIKFINEESCVGIKISGGIISHIILSLSFAWLIVNVSLNRKSLFSLDNRIFNFLGEISYGIYMYHMLIIFVVILFLKNHLAKMSGVTRAMCQKPEETKATSAAPHGPTFKV